MQIAQLRAQFLLLSTFLLLLISGCTDLGNAGGDKENMSTTDNLAKAEAFLKENATREGIIVTESGLQYEVIESGSGKTPQRSDTVVTHYAGRFLDGTEFDSSISRGEPLSFPVTGVIAGWTEALLLMQEGDKWRLYIPPELGYGERGAGGAIPGNTALIFDINLIEVR